MEVAWRGLGPFPIDSPPPSAKKKKKKRQSTLAGVFGPHKKVSKNEIL